MDGVDAAAPGGVVRVLVGISAALGGAVLCVLIGAGSAHADTGQPSGSGLLGGVVHSVTSTVDTVGSTASTVSPSAPAHAPAATPAPATPVASPAVTRLAPASARPTSAPVTSIVEPLADTVDSTVATLPLVGALSSDALGDAPVAELTAPVGSLVDSALGAAVTAVVPVGDASREPFAALPPGGSARSGAAASGAADAVRMVSGLLPVATDSIAAAVSGVAPVSTPPGGALPGSPGGSPATGMLPVSTSVGSPSPAPGMLAAGALLGMLLLGFRHRTDRRAVPGSPVFDTDSSPD